MAVYQRHHSQTGPSGVALRRHCEGQRSQSTHDSGLFELSVFQSGRTAGGPKVTARARVLCCSRRHLCPRLLFHRSVAEETFSSAPWLSNCPISDCSYRQLSGRWLQPKSLSHSYRSDRDDERNGKSRDGDQGYFQL